MIPEFICKQLLRSVAHEKERIIYTFVNNISDMHIKKINIELFYNDKSVTGVFTVNAEPFKEVIPHLATCILTIDAEYVEGAPLEVVSDVIKLVFYEAND